MVKKHIKSANIWSTIGHGDTHPCHNDVSPPDTNLPMSLFDAASSTDHCQLSLPLADGYWGRSEPSWGCLTGRIHTSENRRVFWYFYFIFQLTIHAISTGFPGQPWGIDALVWMTPEHHSLKGWKGWTQSTTILTLHAKFFRGNINIYLHFVPLLHIDTMQVVEILPQIRQEPTYST